MRVLGGSLPKGSARPTSIVDWIDGAYKYTASWKHVDGAQVSITSPLYCVTQAALSCHHSLSDFGLPRHLRTPPPQYCKEIFHGPRYNDDPVKECRHTYTTVRKSPPVKVALRVVDSATPTRVLVDAQVETTQLHKDGSKTVLYKGSAQQQNNLIIYDKIGTYQVMVCPG